jgi:3-hydroxyacyl-CoA dehydrogenase
MTITKVTLAGTGIFGAQIAFQTAFHGYAVMVYDISDAI